MKEQRSREELVNLEAAHDVLFAIDSDGCVFDSMTVKQRIFREGVIEYWHLEDRAAEVHRICEWVGLFSPWRGLNRFQLLLQFFESLEQYVSGVVVPRSSLSAFVQSAMPLSMEVLERWIQTEGAAELQSVLEWSRTMSRRIAQLPPIPVFEGVSQGLQALRRAADLIVVSQTTEEALVREWNQADLAEWVQAIAGAEWGSKRASLVAAMADRYDSTRTVMVGDATGDLEAARVAGCLFFPILPGDEVASWAELCSEGLERVRSGSFAGAYQAELIARFQAVLTPTFPGR